MPDVSGKTEDQAVALLQKEGFVIGKTAEKNSDEVAEGKVINTDPEAGEMKEKGTKINLFVSIGSKKNNYGRLYRKKLHRYKSVT